MYKGQKIAFFEKKDAKKQDGTVDMLHGAPPGGLGHVLDIKVGKDVHIGVPYGKDSTKGSFWLLPTDKLPKVKKS